MHTFKTYLNGLPFLEEGLHPEIKSVLDSDINSSYKMQHVARTIKRLLHAGEDTGLDSDKPLKGSSRAVYLHKEPHKIILDGKEAHIPSVTKIAFPGSLDKYNKSGALLGEHQNLVEADRFTNHRYGIITHKADGLGFETNHEAGVLAPLLESHPEGHYNHFGRIRPVGAGDFQRLTKTPDFPKGITHANFHEALMLHHNEAHGQYRPTPEKIRNLQKHPFVEKVQDFVGTTGQHPADLNKRNMGIWTHPHTGEDHLVISDYGFSHTVAKQYQDARKNMVEAKTRETPRWQHYMGVNR